MDNNVPRITIGHLNNQRASQAFCDYLKTQNIQAWVEEEKSLFLVVINDPTVENLACAELRDFLSNPSDPKYLDASWNEGSTNSELSSTTQATDVNLKSFLSRSGVMTRSLVIISILVTFITSYGENMSITKYLMIADITNYQGDLVEIYSGELWRLVTPIFLHFMTLHILFNMMWLWDLGGTVEKKQSPQFLLFFVISIGIMSNVIQYISSGPAFGGMSGVVYGLLGYTWIRSLKAKSGYKLPNSIIGFMMVWLVLGYTGWIGPIGNESHLSGLILGIAYGFAWNQYE